MTEQTEAWSIRPHPELKKAVDVYIKKNKKALELRRLANRNALTCWALLEIIEGRIDPCPKSKSKK